LIVQVAATYFDGYTATPVAVQLTVNGGELVLRRAEGESRWPLHEVKISERLGNTPRLISFAQGGHCEVTDHTRFDALLDELGLRKSWLDKMQHSLGWAALALLLLVVVAVGSYRYLLPWAAEKLATEVPALALQKMSESTLQLLNRYALQPSKLSAERQQAIAASFARLNPETAGAPHYRILFYRSAAMGANAFALPDGTLVVLDDLVALAQDDNEVDAVLAHELGHVQLRHGVRLLLQSSIVGLALTWYVGDFSTLLAGAPAVLLQARYSRDMESEADAYSAQLLQRNGLSSCLLADMLDRLEADHRKKEAARHDQESTQTTSIAADYLSSHPATRKRIQALCPGR
jgi:Zn-dependent protease with chaperone function